MKVTYYENEMSNFVRNHMVDVCGYVNGVLSELNPTDVLVSPTTGETFQASELPRVLGILTGLLENGLWEVR